MENKNLDSYGYLLNCPDEMLGDVNKTMNDKRAIINWNNFNVGDAFYTENIYRCAMVDHVMKRIVFVTEEECKNEFELRYNNNKYKKPDMREKIREYINELDMEIDRLEDLLKNTDNPYDLQIKGRLNAIIEVKNDLLGRLEEVIQMKRLDIYKTNDGKSLVLLNNETDSNGYINYLPITNSANGMSVNTKSGNPVIIDIDNVSIIKMNKLESYIDHVIESDFDFKIKWYIDGRQREEVKD